MLTDFSDLVYGPWDRKTTLSSMWLISMQLVRGLDLLVALHELCY